MRRGFPVLFLLAAPLCGQAVFQFSGLDDGNGAQPLVKAMGTACPGAINAKCPLATLQLGNTVIHMDDAHGNVFDGTITLNLQTTTPPLQAANPGVFQGTMPVAFALSGKWQHPALPTGQEAYWYTVSYFGPNFPIRDQDPCNTNQTFSPEQMVTGNGPETVTFTSSCTAMANLDWSGSGGVVTQLTGWAYLTLNLVFGNDNDEILLAFEFHYAPPAVSTTDTATISSTTPAADSTVDFNSPFTVAASGQVTLASQSQAQWALRLYDQNNILQATSTPANISSGTPTTVSPTVSVSSLPSSVSWLKARLEVFDPATSKVLVQSQPDVLIHAAPAIRIEALQVVQTTSNTVNLKTGAPVVYRVFLSSRGTGSDSKAYSGTLSGAGQGAILVGAQTMAASQNPSRESLTNSLNFVDTHATVGPATVTFNLTDAQGGSTGITKSAPLTFVARTGAPPSVDVQILCYQALGMTMDCSVTPHLPDWISSDITLNVLPDWLTYTSDLSKPDNQAGLLQFLAKLYLDGQLKGHTGSQLVGFLPDLTALNLNGSTAANVTRRGYSPVEANIHQNWGVAWVQNNSSSLPEETMLHEIAHGFGLLDTGNFISPAWELLCGGPAPDPNWPFADATINDPGYIVSGLLPSTSIDVMSHCPAGLFGSYILASSYTYNKLLQATGYRSTAPVTALEAAKTAASEAAAAGGTAVLVSGTITTAGSVTLDPLHSATVASLPPAGATAGAYCVVLTGATTERSCFDLSFQITDPTQPGGTVTLTQQGFAFLMHQPDSLQQVAVTQGNSTLLSRTPSAHAPTVNITAPAANAIWSEGTNTVSWQGADADNNPLWYSLAYSPDGGTSWYSLVLDTQQTQWNVATSEILGGKNVRFRVTVSDGLLGSTAEVGPVTVQQMPALTLPAAPFAGGSTLLAVPLQVPVPLKRAIINLTNHVQTAKI
jgi:hypothetical protein